MALINCPKCGKQISDTTNKCIHCGYDLAESKDKQSEYKQYYKLSAAEQKALRAEFYKTDPAYAECDKQTEKMAKKSNITSVLRLVFGGITLLILVITQICSTLSGKKFENNVLLWVAIIIVTVGLLIAFIAFVLNIVFRLKFKKLRHNQLIIEKRFQKWLKCEKQTMYTVQFSSKQKNDKAFFDSINVDRTQLEV